MSHDILWYYPPCVDYPDPDPNPIPLFQSKMSLQLYQVDQKSYLLDFKSLSNVEIHESMSSSSSLEGGRMPLSPPSSCSDLGESSLHRNAPC